MYRTAVIIIGAGQAGLSVSRLLTEASVEHVVIDRGQVADRWRSQRWDSLRLLTPNWMTRLPNWCYSGTDPTGFLPALSVAELLDSYAESFAAPVVTGTEVLSVRACDNGFVVVTDTATWSAPAVVVATGHCAVANTSAYAADLDPAVTQLTADTYHHPGDVPDGPVLVVGASATGVQLADELRTAGRDVVLAVGSHTRMVRRYRGMDVMWWLDALGLLTQPVDADHAGHAERSLQLVGSGAGRDVDLGSLESRGINLVGRIDGSAYHDLIVSDDLVQSRVAADAKLNRLLTRIDDFATKAGLDREIDTASRPAPYAGRSSPRRLTLGRRGIRTVVWATGYHRNYNWLHLPVLDAAGEIRHVAGRTPVPGLCVVGMAWQTRRNSTFLDGVGHDAGLVAEHILTDILHATPARRSAS